MCKTDFEKTVVQTITELYDDFFQAERKIADFILENPNVAVNANVSELANYSGVSDATVIRFCKHLGFSGYYQLRLCLSRDIGRGTVEMGKMNPEDTSLQSQFRQLADLALACGSTVNESVFQNVIKLILGSTMVHLAGAGNTSALCIHYGWRIERLGIRCSYNVIPEYFMGHLNTGMSTDVLLAISKSGTSRSVVTALELARNKGMKTVVVTGHRYSPASRVADYLLLTSSGQYDEDLLPSTSCIGEMIVMDALTNGLRKCLAAKDDSLDQEILLSDSKF